MLELIKNELFLKEFTQFSMLFAFFVNIAVGLVFLYIYNVKKKNVFFYFSLSWIIYGISYIFKIIKFEHYAIFLDISSKLLTSLSIIFLIAGILIYINAKNLKRYLYLFSSLLILFSVIFPILELPELWSRIFIYFIYGITNVLVGFALLKKEKYSLLPSIGIILWGIHKFDYPFLVNSSFAPFGYMISFILGLIVSIGLMMMVSQKEYDETIKAYNELKIQRKNTSKLMLTISHNLRNPLTAVNEALEILKLKQIEIYKEENYLDSKDLINLIESNIKKINSEISEIEQLFLFMDFDNTSNFEIVKLSDVLSDLENELKQKSFKISILNKITTDSFIYADRKNVTFTISSLLFLLNSKNALKETKFVVSERKDSIIFCLENLKDGKKFTFIDYKRENDISEIEATEKMIDSEIYGFIKDSIVKHRGKIFFNRSKTEGGVDIFIELPKYIVD